MLFLIKQISPSIDFLIKKIKNNEYFYYCKLNHAFFEATCLQDKSQKQRFEILHSSFYLEIIEIIKKIPDDNNFLFAFSDKPYKSYESYSHKEILRFLYSLLPKHKRVVYDSLLFKKYCINGEIIKLFDLINLKKMKVILYGLDHLKNINNNIGFLNFEFRKVNIDATKEKENLIERLISKHEDNSIYFFQLGEVLSTWAIYNLYFKIKDSYFIDVGRSVDYFVNMEEMKFSEEDEIKYIGLSKNNMNLNNHFINCFSNKNWMVRWKEN